MDKTFLRQTTIFKADYVVVVEENGQDIPKANYNRENCKVEGRTMLLTSECPYVNLYLVGGGGRGGGGGGTHRNT